MEARSQITRIDTLVIGGGQAGLAVGYHLARRGLSYRIVDAHPRVGDAWRNRWDSLRLFTPARFAGLDGMRFPGPPDAFPTKDQVAAYLEAYAHRFELRIENGVRIERLERTPAGEFVATAGARRYVARNVVVAMANYQVPAVPAFAAELDPRIRQLHAHAYRNPEQLLPGGVLVVGVGNSGADIALEASRTHDTWLAGRESGALPFDIESPLALHALVYVVRFVGHRVLSLDTPLGRRARPGQLHRTSPLIRVRPVTLARAGVRRVPRVVGVNDGRPVLADGSSPAVTNVIWCTGYAPDFSWVHLPVFDADGMPRHASGVVTEALGLYFVGLHFLHAMSSATLVGVSRDAARVVADIARRSRSRNVSREMFTAIPGRPDRRRTEHSVAR